MKKKTIVLGASINPARYSHAAVRKLIAQGFEVVPVGIREGHIGSLPIATGQPSIKDVHTVSLYLNPERQQEHYDYILSLSPKRIIFNPGTENPELIRMAGMKGIETEVACTLVLLSTGVY
ncbi:MAG: CoA-binding protein [Bacteroidota bacterium]